MRWAGGRTARPYRNIFRAGPSTVLEPAVPRGGRLQNVGRDGPKNDPGGPGEGRAVRIGSGPIRSAYSPQHGWLQTLRSTTPPVGLGTYGDNRGIIGGCCCCVEGPECCCCCWWLLLLVEIACCMGTAELFWPC